MVVVLLVYAVDLLAKATISTTGVLLNGLRTDDLEKHARQVFWSPWHEVEYPEPLTAPGTYEFDLPPSLDFVGLLTVTLMLAGYLWPRFVQRCTRAHAIALAPEKSVLRLLTVVVLGIATIIVLSRSDTFSSFGCFFAGIRGRNGLQKGLSYFVALVVPHAAITVIFVPAGISDWTDVGVWVLQIFTQTMLLGVVAGDYELLRRSGLGWSRAVRD